MGVPPEPPANSSGMYKLDVELKRGHNLAVRDRGGADPASLLLSHLWERDARFCLFLFPGSSDPYVKFKMAGKEVFRSKTIHKNLNPVWDQKTTLIIDSLTEPLYVKVRTTTGILPPLWVDAGLSGVCCSSVGVRL